MRMQAALFFSDQRLQGGMEIKQKNREQVEKYTFIWLHLVNKDKPKSSFWENRRTKGMLI